jgi:hypothetical protein
MMKTIFNTFRIITVLIAAFMLIFTCSCDKDKNDDDNNDQGKMWDPDWLIGTWEGTTPSTVTPFENTKIRIVIEEYNLEAHDTLPGGSFRKAYAYKGTFTWDVDDNGAWSMMFDHANYPLPDWNVIIWDCINYTQAGQTVNNISLRINDTTQTDPLHSIPLDWGPVYDNSGNPPAFLDFYGDVEITTNGNFEEAVYPPDQTSTMIRLTKK